MRFVAVVAMLASMCVGIAGAAVAEDPGGDRRRGEVETTGGSDDIKGFSDPAWAC
jgi:hypothetical protein